MDEDTADTLSRHRRKRCIEIVDIDWTGTLCIAIPSFAADASAACKIGT